MQETPIDLDLSEIVLGIILTINEAGGTLTDEDIRLLDQVDKGVIAKIDAINIFATQTPS